MSQITLDCRNWNDTRN